MFVPVLHNFTAYRGATFDTRLTLFTDVAETVPFDLTPYAASMVIGTALVLTEGSGLVNGGAAGTLDIRIAPADTSVYQSEHYALKITGTSDAHFILHGTFAFLAA